MLDIRVRGLLDEPCPQCGALARIEDQTGPCESQVVVRMRPEMGGDLGVLRHDGSVQIVTDRIGEHLATTLASDAVWAIPSEPAPTIGRGTRQPAAIALSPDGTEVRDQVFQSGHGAYGISDVPVDGPIALAAASAVPEGPSPRSDFRTVHSRSTGRLFLVGGPNQATGARAHLIRRA